MGAIAIKNLSIADDTEAFCFGLMLRTLLNAPALEVSLVSSLNAEDLTATVFPKNLILIVSRQLSFSASQSHLLTTNNSGITDDQVFQSTEVTILL